MTTKRALWMKEIDQLIAQSMEVVPVVDKGMVEEASSGTGKAYSIKAPDG